MKILCKSQEEYKAVRALIKESKLPADTDVLKPKDCFAYVVWSADDVHSGNCSDDRADDLTPKEKVEFMEFAESQLIADMTDRGFASLSDLFTIRFGPEPEYQLEEEPDENEK